MTSRKLQAEIDKVVKKVSEGVEIFDSIYEKINQTQNAAQKEKLEGDLKKEIKKLQRYRDQIKFWINLSEIKDKKTLIENRKRIELEMEKFKACEKELKTKAFSKEGLQQNPKIDPEEREKEDLRTWIGEHVDKLNTQIDALEAEQEQLQASMKKSRKTDHSKAERLSQIDNRLDRHNFHVNKLELIQRLLDNNSLTVQQVVDVKDDVNYYVEDNMEPDFDDSITDEIYAELNLDDADGFGIPNDNAHESESDSADDLHSPPAAPKQDKKNSFEDVASPKKNNKKSVKAAKVAAASPVRTSINSPSTSKAPEPVAPLPVRYSAAAAAPADTAASSSSATTNTTKVGALPTSAATDKRSFKAAAQAVDPTAPREMSLAAGKPDVSTKVKERSDSTGQPPINQPQQSNISPLPHPSPIVAHSILSAAPVVPVPEVVTPTDDNRLPPSVSDLVASFEATRERSSRAKEDPSYIMQMLETSARSIPDLQDYERPKYYHPKAPYPASSYYPQVPLPVFENPVLFDKFNIDTLFFIFYYHQGTFQQYLAARELKRQSWRFHKKYLTWFQRHEEPKAITDTYEQGTYIYFDYEGAWCQRKKSEFRFEYRFLEDAELA